MPQHVPDSSNPSLFQGTSVPELLSALEHKNHIIEDKNHIIEEQQKIIALLEEQLRLATVRRYASSSEKYPYLPDLFDEAELEAALDDIETQVNDTNEQHQEPKKPERKKRKGFNPKLDRVRVEIKLTDEQREGASRTFFTKVKEELDHVPAKMRILEYWQEKAVFEQESGESRVESAERSNHPLGKCIASVQLLAYVLVAKYADAIPLYRLEKILSRYGESVTRTTLANWIIALEVVLRPLLKLLREEQLKSNYLQADETRIKVLKEDGRVSTSDKWMWLVRGGTPGKSIVLFEYDPSSGEEVPLRLLKGFSGTLQCDGHAGYGRACREYELTRIGCWDHARRKFTDAAKAAPVTKKGAKASKAEVAIGMIRKLYRIETKIKDLPPEDKLEIRQKLSKPALEEFKTWLEVNIRRVPKNSETWNAINYSLNQWETLTKYTEDGHLNISNALAENAIRPFAVGRRNWLFADTARGARASAACYSLIETAKANGLEPFTYVRYVLRHIGDADTIEKLEMLLPWNMPREDV